jgi:hypothetical protein
MAVIGSKRERLPNRRLPSTWRPTMSGEQRRTAHTDTAAKPVTVSKFDIFIARAWARATLFAAGEMTLHTAVDQFQQDAVASGLVAELGQDEIQHIMSAAFAPVRHDVGVTARDPDPVEVEREPDQARAAASYVVWWPDIGLPGTSGNASGTFAELVAASALTFTVPDHFAHYCPGRSRADALDTIDRRRSRGRTKQSHLLGPLAEQAKW